NGSHSLSVSIHPPLRQGQIRTREKLKQNRRVPPPPMMAKKLDVTTTIRIQDLPPVITKTAEHGILAAARTRTDYLSRGEAADTLEATEARLGEWISEARQECNIRDYVTLLVELAMLRLAVCAGPPTEH